MPTKAAPLGSVGNPVGYTPEEAQAALIRAGIADLTVIDTFKKPAPVLIVIEGGVAEVRYCPPGVVVLVKDFDCENDTARARTDANGEPFTLDIQDHDSTKMDPHAEREAVRLLKNYEG